MNGSDDRNYVSDVLVLFDEFGDSEAFRTGQEHLTFAQTAARVREFAAVLHGHGLRAGDGIAILAGNRPESVILQLAGHLLGCRTVWISTWVAAREQAAFIRLADVRAFIFDTENYADRGRELAAGTGTSLVLPLGPNGLPDGRTAADGTTPPPVGPGSAVATLYYTSGSTGRPKLVEHRHVLYQVLMLAAAQNRADDPTCYRFLVCTPITHASGQASALLILLSGSTLVLRRGFDAGETLRTIEQDAVHGLFLSPAMLRELLAHPLAQTAELGSLQSVTYGGGPISASLLKAAIDRFGPVMRQVYGLVESIMVTSLLPADHDLDNRNRISSCGRPITATEVTIQDDSGRILPPSEIGEVCVKGPLMMAGYWREPELTAQTLRDGWLHTGDLGFLDDEGFLHLVDRAKDVIVTGRYATNVYSILVEDVLAEHADVDAAAVIGLPDPVLGERVHAVVVPGADRRPTLEELRTFVRQRLGELYCPASVRFVARLPLNATGKVDKPALRSQESAAAVVNGVEA